MRERQKQRQLTIAPLQDRFNKLDYELAQKKQALAKAETEQARVELQAAVTQLTTEKTDVETQLQAASQMTPEEQAAAKATHEERIQHQQNAGGQ